MPLHEQKQCPRCSRWFECRSGSISRCQCQAVELSRAQLDYIADRYDDCLCADCLQALQGESGRAS